MGSLAREKRKRRELLAEQRQRSAALNERFRDPETQARLADMFDAECEALRDRHAPGQRERLTAAGWRQREENNDGIGIWDRRDQRIVQSVARETGGQVWAHVSLSNRANTMPTWYEVRNAGWLLYPSRFGIVVIAPESRHINIANVAHVWYCLTAASCPDFSHGMDSI